MLFFIPWLWGPYFVGALGPGPTGPTLKTALIRGFGLQTFWYSLGFYLMEFIQTSILPLIAYESLIIKNYLELLATNITPVRLAFIHQKYHSEYSELFIFWGKLLNFFHLFSRINLCNNKKYRKYHLNKIIPLLQWFESQEIIFFIIIGT